MPKNVYGPEPGIAAEETLEITDEWAVQNRGVVGQDFGPARVSEEPFYAFGFSPR